MSVKTTPNKLNYSFIYYLLTKCKYYSFHFKNESESYFLENLSEQQFLFIDIIKKHNKIVFNIEDFDKQIEIKIETEYERLRRKEQLIQLTNLIQKESGISFHFKEMKNNFQLISIFDKNIKKIDVEEFINKNYHFYQMNDFISQNNCYRIKREKELIENCEKEFGKIVLDQKWIYDSVNCQRIKFIRMINDAMINYLKTECKNYEMKENQNNSYSEFHYVDVISKGNEVIFDIQDFHDELKSKNNVIQNQMKRKNQIHELARLIEIESGIKFKFNSCLSNLKLLYCIDKNNNTFELFNFVKKYYKINSHSSTMQMKQNQKYDDSDETISLDIFEEAIKHSNMQLKWKFQNPDEIEQLLKSENADTMKFDKQCSIINCKLNIVMMIYLRNVCKEYTFLRSSETFENDPFVYINKIKKGDTYVFDINDFMKILSKLSEIGIQFHKRKIQMIKLAELIEKESGIKIEFSDNLQLFQIVKFVDKDQQPINLFQFIKKYENQIQMNQNVPQQKQIKDIKDIERIQTMIKSFNNSLIIILNKFHYLMTFVKPQPMPTNRIEMFLLIKSIQKELNSKLLYENKLLSDQIKETDKSSLDIKEKEINFLQMKEMMKLIEQETNILFLFEIEDLMKLQFIDHLKIKLMNKTIFIDEFIQQFNDKRFMDFLTLCISFTNYNESYEMNKFIELKQNEMKLEKIIDEKYLNEWKQIFIYFLINVEYSITFTKETLKQCNNNLMIESIEKNNEKVILSTNREEQMKELINKINTETNYEIVYHEMNSIVIPLYLRLKNKRNEKYFPHETISVYKVNEIIKRLLQKQFVQLMHKETIEMNQRQFSKDYLMKRFDE